MKKYLDIFVKWIVLGLWFFLVIWFGFYLIKARNSSSSWLTVDGTSPAALYVGAGETLTAAKRNRLVQNAQWQEVSTSDTSVFDSGCDRKWQFDNWNYDNIVNGTNNWTDWTRIYCGTVSYNYYLDYNSKWTSKNDGNSTTRPTLHVRKKCK